MKAKIVILLVVLAVSVFLIGCGQTQSSGYSSYNQPQGQPQGGQYVGGGCGVAPGDYAGTPVEGFGSAAASA